MSLSLSLLDCWALSVDLVNVLLSCPNVINVPGSEVDLSLSSPYSPSVLPSPPLSDPPKLLCCPTVSAPSVSATLAPSAGAGRRCFVGKEWKKNSFFRHHQLLRCYHYPCWLVALVWNCHICYPEPCHFRQHQLGNWDNNFWKNQWGC